MKLPSNKRKSIEKTLVRNCNEKGKFITVTVKVCKKNGCKCRVKKESDRVFCFRHDPKSNYMTHTQQRKSLSNIFAKKYDRNYNKIKDMYNNLLKNRWWLKNYKNQKRLYDMIVKKTDEFLEYLSDDDKYTFTIYERKEICNLLNHVKKITELTDIIRAE